MYCVVGVVLMIPKGSWAMVYAPTGQALNTVYAVEDALLDKVIAATKVGVRSTTTGRTVTGWGIGRFSASALSPILTIAMTAAGVAWSPYILPWLESHLYEWDAGVVKKHGAGTYQASASATGIGAMSGETSGGVDWALVFVPFGTAPGAYMGCWSDHPGSCSVDTRMRDVYGWDITKWQFSCAEQHLDPGNWHYSGCMAKPKTSAYAGYVEYVEGALVPVTDGEIQSTYQSDFATDESLSRAVGIDLVNWMGDVVDEANEEWPASVPKRVTTVSGEQQDAIQETVNDAIDDQTKGELQESADQNGTTYPPGSLEAGSDWEYTPEQMATAQYERDLQREAEWVTDWNAEKPDDGNTSELGAGDYTLPERKDLGGVLDTFKSSLDSLPIISWVNGVELEVSGASSVVSLPLPEAWGSSITVDFADYENILDMMGNGLYALVGMASILFLFRGRGD